MRKLNENIYVQSTSDGLNVGCVVDKDGAVSIDLPLNVDEALQWHAQIRRLAPKPLRAIIFTSAERVNSDALKALAPNLGAFGLPAIIHDAGFNQLYAALEASQPRMLEPLSPVQLRERAVLPDMTYSDSATFTLGLENPVRIDITSAANYSPGSSIVLIRDTGVAFVGSLVAGNEPPFLHNANLEAWQSLLANLRRNRKIKVIVAASGPVGDMALVARTQAYLKAAQSGIHKLVRAHKPRESLSALAADLVELFGSFTGSYDVVVRRVQSGLEYIYDMTLAQAVEPPPQE
ncbi:MAG: hypothetical protein M1434_13140 [Chloroflexi bacterium]|nr:hypothetical protein [Chloroflexota bacterium]MCL5275667.1 hypothetical protein [Chloroflexota bacterium]